MMTQCYIADAAITMNCARKRSIDDSPLVGVEEVPREMIRPSSAEVVAKDDTNLNQVIIKGPSTVYLEFLAKIFSWE